MYIMQYWVTSDTPASVTLAVKNRAQAIEQKHNVPVTVATQNITDGDAHESYVCTPIPEEDQVGQLTMLQKELSKMPAAALQKVKIKEIVLCGDLEERWNIWPHFKTNKTLRGLSNEDTHTLYLSSENVFNNGLSVFHHELFHVMWGRTGSCGSNVLSPVQDYDDEWNNLEPHLSNIDANEERANYAMDLFNLNTKAGQERYDALMQEPGSRAKMNKVKDWMKYVDPRLNKQFWADLRNGQVTENYWDNH